MEVLSVLELAVVSAEIINDREEAAVEWLKNEGHKMSSRSYRRHKKKIHEQDTKRLYELAKAAKENQMQRIDEFKTLKKETWRIYNKSTDDAIKLRALKQIKELSPFITAAEAAVPYIIKEEIENFGKPGRDTKKQERIQGTTEQSS